MQYLASHAFTVPQFLHLTSVEPAVMDGFLLVLSTRAIETRARMAIDARIVVAKESVPIGPPAVLVCVQVRNSQGL